MEDIREQMELGQEISNAISNPVGMGHDVSSLQQRQSGPGQQERAKLTDVEADRRGRTQGGTGRARARDARRSARGCPSCTRPFTGSEGANDGSEDAGIACFEDGRGSRRGCRVARASSCTGHVISSLSLPLNCRPFGVPFASSLASFSTSIRFGQGKGGPSHPSFAFYTLRGVTPRCDLPSEPPIFCL